MGEANIFSEVITFHVGQCGNQVGLQYWNQMALEHGISLDGTALEYPNEQMTFGNSDSTNSDNSRDDRTDVFFTNSTSSRYIPRAILIDLEPSVINKCTAKIPMFNPRNIHLSEQGSGAANNWQHGYKYGLHYQEELVDLIDRECDKCENLSTFHLVHSVAGGTGSGVGSLLLELLNDRYGSKKITNTSLVFPSSEKTSDVVVQPYNTLLTLKRLIEFSDGTFVFENDALNSIEMSLFGVHSSGVDRLNGNSDSAFEGVNKLISLVLTSISNPLRFPNYMYSSNESILSSLIPTPDLKFLTLSIAPFSSWGRQADVTTRHSFTNLNEYDIVLELLNDRYKMNKVGSSTKYISILNYIIGDHINQHELRRGTIKAQLRVEFVPWTSSSFHTANCRMSPYLRRDPCNSDPRNLQGVEISNNTSVAHVFTKVVKQFDLLAKREAYINYYTLSNDREERSRVLDVFNECRESVMLVIEEYNLCSSMNYLEDEILEDDDII